MQRCDYRCPCCDQPLGISCDMWGRYYICGGCGFTAEDDDELNGKGGKATPSPAAAELFMTDRSLPRIAISRR